MCFRRTSILMCNKKWISFGFTLFFLWSCSSLPTVRHEKYFFPKETAFFGDVRREYKKLGLVRSKVNYQTLDLNHDEEYLCVNYFNRAVEELVRFARKKGGDAVIDVRSVVFFENGEHELHPSAECSDDGMEGQVLAQGVAIQWLSSSSSGSGDVIKLPK